MLHNVIGCFERRLLHLWIAHRFCRRVLPITLCLVTGVGASFANEIVESRAVIELTAGTEVSHDIAANDTNSLEISLTRRQVLRVSIEKGDLALSLSIYSPTDERLFEEISNRYESLEVLLPADADGKYRLEIRSLESTETTRPYHLRVGSLAVATAADLRAQRVQQLLANASLLRSAWTEQSLRQAIDYYDSARALSLSRGDFHRASIAANLAGETCVVIGEYREALKRYQMAVQAANSEHDNLAQAQSESQIGRLLSYLGKNDDAQVHLAIALRFLESPTADQSEKSKQVYAVVLSSAGEVSYSKGDLLKALTDFDKAGKLFEAFRDRTGEARVHLYEGYIAGSLGEPEKAVAEISHAMVLFRAVKNRSGEGSCLTALGVSHSLRREEEQAIKLHREAGDIFREIGDRQNEAITLNGLGQAFEFLNEYQIALQNYQQSLSVSLERGNLDFAAAAEFKVARVYRLMGDIKRALEHYQECLRLSRSAGKKRTEANALNDVAQTYAAQGNREKTISQYQKILKFYGQISDRHGQATALNNLGDTLLTVGSKREALDSYKRALPLSEQTGDKEVITSTLYNIARVERDFGAFDSALTHIQRSINEIEDMRTKVASPGFRMSYFASARRHYDLYIDILMQLDHQRPGEGFAATALIASESARARSLLDLLTEARADIRQGATPELLERERHLSALIRSQAQYQMEVSVSGDNSGETEQVKRAIDQLESEYLQIETDLRDHNQRFLSLSQGTPLNLDQIRAELGDNQTILLEYTLGDDRSYLWAVTSDSLITYELPARSVLEAAGRDVRDLLLTRETLAHKQDDDYTRNVEKADRLYFEKAARLSQLLLGDVADQLGTKRLLIVTEGMLQYVPIDALPCPAQKVTSETATSLNELWGAAPLVAAHEVVMLPSISSLASIRAERRNSTSNDRLVAVLADPVFSNNDDRVKKEAPNVAYFSSASDTSSPRPALRDFAHHLENGSTMRLIHASDEVDAILATAPRGTVMVAKDFDANREKAMSSQLGEYQIVHFATHGFFNSEHPEFSGVVLSMINQDGTSTDGFLPLEDIYRMNLSAKLVVLSACETALGKNVKGEGVVGLTRAFMYAGARSVVTSLWKVDDRATAALMNQFYKSMLQDGMTPASALRAAKLKIREEKTWSAPYFWAGFVLQGEYKDHVEVQRGSEFRTVVQISIVAILISIALVIVQKSRNSRHRQNSAVNTHSQ